MTSREKFEAWWVKGNDGCQPRSGWEKLRTDDGYNDEFIDFQYEGFKAAEEIFQQQLEESRREFRAADATIHNLELQLTDLAVQLANAESKCRELAAENGRCKFEISRCHQTVDEMFKNRDKWVDKEWLSAIWSTSKRLMNETPATSAFLSEVLASELDSLAGVAETMLVKFSNQRCSQDMHEVVGWKMVLQQASNRAAKLRKGAVL